MNKHFLDLLKNKSVRAVFIAFCGALMIPSCSGRQSADPASSVQPREVTESDTGFILYGTYDYDSEDSPVLVKKDTEQKTLTFLNTAIGKRYTLGYDGTTEFYDKYGKMISLEQISEGDILNVRFVKNKRHLTCAGLSSDAWVKPGTDQYIIDNVKKEVTIGTDIYKISDSVFCYSGREELLYQELNSVDVLSFSGVGTTVYSIVVDKGHGYLRLSGQEYFVDGWIEVGTKYIQKITEEMLLTVPEGTYNIVVSGSGMRVDRSVTIKSGLETVLDLSGIQPEKPKEGLVLFSLTPSDATLYIDGEKADTSSGIKLTYGLHQLMCSAEGYKTVTRYLSVGEENAGVSIVLEKESAADTSVQTGPDTGEGDKKDDTDGKDGKDNKDDKDSKDDKDQAQGPDQTTSSYDKVYINAPAGAECYLDGNYAGVVPCSFKKEAGSHVITLSMSGYNTKSYTVSVDSSAGDVSYSFADLEKTTK